MENRHEILLGLTTTPHSDWRGKVEEMKKFGIKKIAFFPTFLELKRRKELYDLLENIDDLEIPHAHLREEDFESWELEWFKKRKTSLFNIHMDPSGNSSLYPYRKEIFIENHKNKPIPEDELESFGGICLDYQHWEKSKRQFPEVATATEKYAQKFKIGCCHVSAMPKWKNNLIRMIKKVGGHYMISLDELDYVCNYRKFLPQYISIELENSFEEQLKAKKYLEEILNL